MNKIFNKVRKNRALALLLAFAMMLSILPFDTVLAEPATPTVAGFLKVDGLTDVSDKYAGAVAAFEFTTSAEYYPQFILDVEGHSVADYDKVAFEFTPGHDGMLLRIENYDPETKSYVKFRGHDPVTGAATQTLEYSITKDIPAFRFYLDADVSTYAEKQTFVLHTITFSGEGKEDVVIGTPYVDDGSGDDTTGDDTTGGDSTGDDTTGDDTTGGDSTGDDTTGGDTTGGDGGNTDAPTVPPTVTGIIGMNGVEDVTASVDGAVAAVKFTHAAATYYDFTVGVKDHNISKYTKAEIEVTPGRDGMLLGIYTSAGKSLDGWWQKPVSGTEKVKLTVDLTASTTNIEGIHFYCEGDTSTPTNLEETFIVHSIKFIDPNEQQEDVVVPEWQVNNGPKVTLKTSSNKFMCNVNEDKSVDITYTAPVGWTALTATVENSNYTKYSHVVIDITPAEGMLFYVYDDTNASIPGARWDDCSAERTTFEFDLSKDVTKFDLWIDPENGAGGRKFTIHSIKIVDPSIPAGELVNAALKDENGTFTFEGTDTVKGTKGTKMRCMFELPVDFKVEAGKQLVIGYETNIEGIGLERAYGTSTIDWAINPMDTAVKSVVFDIDQSWVDFINNNGGKAPRLRLKHEAIGADGYFTLKYVVYRDVPAEQYDPNHVPKGIAVTYYDDIYSRGVAWNTNEEVPASALYYVLSDGVMTADTVEWETATKVDATLKPYTAVMGETSTVWHTFKAVAEDLTPGATYFFRVGSEEYGWSDVGTFKVEKASADIDSLHFIHLTDTQEEDLSSFKKYAKLVKAAYDKMPNAAFMSHTGDMVNNGEKEADMRMDEWMYALDAPKANLMNSVLMPAVGNHDCGQFVYTDRFNISWADYKADSTDDLKTGGAYVKTYGEPENGVLFISLNTNDLWTSQFQEYQQVWLEEQLKTYNDYKWKIVQMHAGAMTGGGHTNDGESKYLRKNVMPLFSKYKVDLVLQGHDHVYTRTRSLAYGVNPFETVDEENPVYFDGHTPVYLSAKEETRVVNGVERTVYIEPQGTHYITINASGGKRYEELDASSLDPIIVEAEGENPINPTDENGKKGSMCTLDLPTYALVSIEGDLLVYDVYTYGASTGTSELYDTFAVDKSSNRGYDPSNPHEGKTKVELYGIKLNIENGTKKYDGVPVQLDLSGFNCSNPAIMDCEQLKYTIEVKSGGVDPVTGKRYTFNPGNLIYGHLPKEPGSYTLKIALPQSNKDFWGETEISFTITQ